MQSITLDTILSEIKRIELVHASEFKNIREELSGVKTEIGEVKTDIAGMKAEIGGIKSEIGGIKSEIGGIKSEIGGIKTEMVKMNTRLGRVEESVEVIRKQTAFLTEGHMDHERRLRKLEGSNA
jgi:chromosome segregation ATPase